MPLFGTAGLHRLGPLLSTCTYCLLRCVQAWDVFDPQRQMQRRRQKDRSEFADTQTELFPEEQPTTVKQPVKNPPRFATKTPKIVNVRMTNFVCLFSLLMLFTKYIIYASSRPATIIYNTGKR